MAKNYIVSNKVELYAALKDSGSGDTISLKGGDYGSLSLNANSKIDLNFEGVTIKSADPSDPAVFSGMDLRGVQNLDIDGVKFDYTFKSGDVDYIRPFAVSNSSGVSVRNSEFSGDIATGVSKSADGFGTGSGLSVRNSSDITIEGNEFTGWLRAAVFDNVKDLDVLNNEAHDIRMDGFTFVAIEGALIEGNHFHNFRGSYSSGDHRDMLQFWTNGSNKPSTDIVIRSNNFDIGEGSYTHSIFMRNEEVDTGRAGQEMFYRNITIENNTIYNGHIHGITVGEVDGLTISHNTLISVPDQNDPAKLTGGIVVPTIRVADGSKNVEVVGNLTGGVSGNSGQSGWKFADNFIIQGTNPNAAGYYGDLFVSSSIGVKDGVNSYVAIPGGVIDAGGYGSAQELGTTKALYMAQSVDPHTWTFDASLTAKLLGASAANAVYIWKFSDGTTAKGQFVTHSFADAKQHDASLTVVVNGKTVLSGENKFVVKGTSVISYDADQLAFVAHKDGQYSVVSSPSSLDGDALQLSPTSSVATISRKHLDALYGADKFTIDFEIKADRPGENGEIFRFHQSFLATMGSDGKLKFTIFNDKGKSITLTSQQGQLNDGKLHDVSVRVENGMVKIILDGVESGSAAFEGTLPKLGSWDLTFGNPWGQKNFSGDISEFSIELISDAVFPDPVKVIDPVVVDPPPQSVAPALPIEVVTPTKIFSELLSYNATDQNFLVHGAGKTSHVSTVRSTDGDAIQITQTGAVATVSRKHLDALYGSDGFSLNFDVKADTAGASGELFRFHQSFLVNITSDGKLQFAVYNDAGKHQIITSKKAALNDGKLHDVSIQLEDGILRIFTDGVETGSAEFSGTLPKSGSWDLTFGNPWGQKNFIGDVSDFSIELISENDGLTPGRVVSAQPHVIGPNIGELVVVGDPLKPTGAEHSLKLDVANLTDKDHLRGATIVEQGTQKALSFDGQNDYVDLGYYRDIDHSDRLAFSVDFSRAGDMVGEERLVWNHMKIGLALKETSLLVHVATANEGLKTFTVKGLDLKNTDQHNVVVMLDKADDHLQVLFNDDIVLNVTDGYDFDFGGLSDRAWTLGTAWDRYFEGQVTDFRLTDTFNFVSDTNADIGMWL